MTTTCRTSLTDVQLPSYSVLDSLKQETEFSPQSLRWVVDSVPPHATLLYDCVWVDLDSCRMQGSLTCRSLAGMLPSVSPEHVCRSSGGSLTTAVPMLLCAPSANPVERMKRPLNFLSASLSRKHRQSNWRGPVRTSGERSRLSFQKLLSRSFLVSDIWRLYGVWRQSPTSETVAKTETPSPVAEWSQLAEEDPHASRHTPYQHFYSYIIQDSSHTHKTGAKRRNSGRSWQSRPTFRQEELNERQRKDSPKIPFPPHFCIDRHAAHVRRWEIR